MENNMFMVLGDLNVYLYELFKVLLQTQNDKYEQIDNPLKQEEQTQTFSKIFPISKINWVKKRAIIYVPGTQSRTSTSLLSKPFTVVLDWDCSTVSTIKIRYFGYLTSYPNYDLVEEALSVLYKVCTL